MTDAYLVGAGQSDYGSFPDESYRSLFATAYEHAIDSVPDGIDPDRIDEAVVGTLGVGGRQLGLAGPAVTEHVGLHGVPTTRVENACAASGYAVRQAVQAVRSGMADVVLAGGVEIMTDASGDAVRYWLGVSGETEWERLSGTTFSASTPRWPPRTCANTARRQSSSLTSPSRTTRTARRTPTPSSGSSARSTMS